MSSEATALPVFPFHIPRHAALPHEVHLPPVERSGPLPEHGAYDASLLSTPQRIGRFVGQCGELAGASWADIKGSPHRLRTVAAGLGTVALQAADRARTSLAFVPWAAFATLEATHNPAYVGAAAGATFGAWCLGIGAVSTEGFQEFSGTVATFQKNFPGVVDFFQQALAGFEQPAAVQPQSRMARIKHRLATALGRGPAVAGIGTLPYVGAASLQRWSRADIHRLNVGASIDGVWPIAALGAIVGGVDVLLGTKYPTGVHRFEAAVSDYKVWLGVAAGSLALTFIANMRKKAKQAEGYPPGFTQRQIDQASLDSDIAACRTIITQTTRRS